jgi:hypothetical protein
MGTAALVGKGSHPFLVEAREIEKPTRVGIILDKGWSKARRRIFAGMEICIP